VPPPAAALGQFDAAAQLRACHHEETLTHALGQRADDVILLGRAQRLEGGQPLLRSAWRMRADLRRDSSSEILQIRQVRILAGGGICVAFAVRSALSCLFSYLPPAW